VSLKKRIVDRFETREDIAAGEVTPTHTEKIQFAPHRAAVVGKNQRKRQRRAQKVRR